MLPVSTETYVAWITWLLVLGFAVAAAAGVRSLSRSRRMRYFQIRRQAVVRGWQLLFASAGLLIVTVLVAGLGLPVLRLAVPATFTPGPTLAASVTPITPTPPASATPSSTPSASATSGPSPTASDTALPTLTGTPQLPAAFVTRILSATVTPPPNAIAANVRFSTRDNCTIGESQAYLDQLPKQVYAHFYYDNWLPGVQWSGVWLRDAAVIFVESHLWDGSTGGCGFSNYDNGKNWWPAGTYEVQIFVGEKWLASNTFLVARVLPTATVTPTRTPRTPTATQTPGATATPQPPTLTPSVTIPPTASPTRTATRTATVRPTRTASPTPSRTPIPSATVLPSGVEALASVHMLRPGATARLRASAPDGPVIAILPDGTPLQVLAQPQQIFNGVVWRQVRLQNGVVGWIAGWLMQITLTR